MTSEVKNNYAYIITFVWDVWFHNQIVCYNVRLLTMFLINKIVVFEIKTEEAMFSQKSINGCVD